MPKSEGMSPWHVLDVLGPRIIWFLIAPHGFTGRTIIVTLKGAKMEVIGEVYGTARLSFSNQNQRIWLYCGLVWEKNSFGSR